MSQTVIVKDRQHESPTPEDTQGSSVVQEQTVAIWDQPIPMETQKSVKRLLEFMIAHNVAPRIDIKAPLVPGVIEAMEAFMPLFPAHLQEDAKALFDYLIRWITDYARETGMKHADLRLELGQKEHN